MTIEEICSTYSSLYKEDNNISIQMFQKTDQIMNPSDLNTNKKNLIIFDDCVNMKNQSVMESYYTRGRHNNCNCIYLSQSWFELPYYLNRYIIWIGEERLQSYIHWYIFKCTWKNEWNMLTSNHWNSQLYLYIAFDKDKKSIKKKIF